MIFGEYDREMDIAVHSEQAREEGREEAREQEKQIIAKNLLAKGSTPEFVSEITGLNFDEIEQLQ